jgi:hypothetical protein
MTKKITKSKEKPIPHIGRSADGDSWIIEVVLNDCYGLLEFYDDGDIVALINKDGQEKCKVISIEKDLDSEDI